MWRNNSLSLVLAFLFAMSLMGHALAGWGAYNDEQRQHGASAVAFVTFVTSSDFGETVFENWESEFLQMGCYVFLTVFLYQRGSAESKKHDGSDAVDEDPGRRRHDAGVPGPVRAGGWRLALYKNSLGLTFAALFLLSFIGHAAAGARKHAAEQRAHDQPQTVTVLSYLRTSQFWYESFQNWQSEFLAVLAIVTLSIHLRQWGSPESKPVHARHDDTGGA